MENKCTIDDQQFIMQLFVAKTNDLQEILNNLKIDEVKEDKAFKRTSERIKNAILLVPVRLQDPKIINHRSEMMNLDPYIYPMGGQRQITIAEVQYPFEGSTELFHYRPDSVSFSDPTVYLPVGNSIIIEVATERLEKEPVLLQAHRQFGLTKSIISAVNIQVENWLKNMESQIDEKLQLKRQEILDFYS